MPAMNLWFDHGLGDCVHFSYLLQLYRKRGWDVNVHYSQNKSFVWKAGAIKYYPEAEGPNYHKWEYKPAFNKPATGVEGSGNKVFLNLNTKPLPPLGEPSELWDELSEIELTADDSVNEEHWQNVDRFLDNLPKPYVLLHTNGTNWAHLKNLPEDTVKKLYKLLLESMDGSIVLLDWDNRVPKLPHARVRHLKDNLGHISLEELYCLMKRSDLMIGVDSGPWHFSKIADIPGVGVFHHHYPACVCLPRQNAVHMTRNSPDYQQANLSRRRRWNLIEYDGNYPSAHDICTHAMRMLAGPRYLRDRSRIGLDVAMQQWVRDWSYGHTNSSWYTDRGHTMDFLLRETTRRFQDPVIVETGCIRSLEDWSGAGNSTYLFAAYLDGIGTGRMYSIDNNLENCTFARETITQWSAKAEVVCSDSASWLQTYEGVIDVLYLDSMDVDLPGHAEYCLREFESAKPNLHDDSLVIIDDTTWNKSWTGKGALLVPALLSEGWTILSSGYQTILSKQ